MEKKEHPSYGVIRICRSSVGGQGVALFGSSIMHNNLITLSISRGMMERGIAYKNMYKCGLNWQKECKDVIEAMYERNVMKNKIFKSFVCELSSIFEKADFKYALLKGAYLTTILYEEGMKTSNVIDILVEEKDIEKCQNLLELNGFIQGYIENEKNKTRYTKRDSTIQNELWGNGAIC